MWELVEATDCIRHHVGDHDLRKSTKEQESMYTGTKALLLNGSNRTLNFADVAVGRQDVLLCREDLATDAFKFIVSVYVAGIEALGTVDIEHRRDLR